MFVCAGWLQGGRVRVYCSFGWASIESNHLRNSAQLARGESYIIIFVTICLFAVAIFMISFVSCFVEARNTRFKVGSKVVGSQSM